MPSDSDIVRAFRGIRALCVGDAMLDSYIDGTASRLCSEGPVPVVRVANEAHAPGGAANSAANLRALGADVRFVGIIGDDAPGAILRDCLRASDVDVRWMITDGLSHTLHKRRIRADGQYVARLDDGDTTALAAASEATLRRYLDAALAWCDVILVSDYGYGAASDAVVARLRNRGSTTLIVDSKQLHRFARAGATVVTPNHIEARLLASHGSTPDVGAQRLTTATNDARTLLGMLDCAFVAVTMAEDGVLLAGRDGEPSHHPGRPVHSAAVAGAGDSFAATLALALAAGADADTAARIGVEASWLAISQPGTTAVSHQQLLQRASLHDMRAIDSAADRAVRDLVTELDSARARGRRIVFTNGVFDILHAGHIHLLREAKALGDVLVVGVNSDASAARLKQRGRPVNTASDRLALVQALESVDHAVLFDEDTPASLIRRLRPDIHVKGGDYHAVSLPEQEAVESVGGRVEILPLAGAHSTSALIDRIGELVLGTAFGASHD